MLKKLWNKKNDKKGFTLVELIVVLIILAILAALLIPAQKKNRLSLKHARRLWQHRRWRMKSMQRELLHLLWMLLPQFLLLELQDTYMLLKLRIWETSLEQLQLLYLLLMQK